MARKTSTGKPDEECREYKDIQWSIDNSTPGRPLCKLRILNALYSAGIATKDPQRWTEDQAKSFLKELV